ncbi:MAG: hypothetical protein ACMXYD_02850 [Candidatus Woesearchaeota archaeon]
MNKHLFIFFAVALLIPAITVANQTQEQPICAAEATTICDLLTEMNVAVGAQTPPILPQNAIINLQLTNQTPVGYVLIQEGTIQEIVCCQLHENATHTASTQSAEVIEQIREADNQLRAANEKLRAKEIVLEANSFQDSVRLAVGKIALRVASWFS